MWIAGEDNGRAQFLDGLFGGDRGRPRWRVPVDIGGEEVGFLAPRSGVGLSECAEVDAAAGSGW